MVMDNSYPNMNMKQSIMTKSETHEKNNISQLENNQFLAVDEDLKVQMTLII